jgi:excisionase family DNA binding protein
MFGREEMSMATASVGSEVLTLAEAAAFLRVPEQSVLRAVAEYGLEARQIDDEWRFLKSAVEDWLQHRSPKARLVAQAGALKDDPYLDAIMESIEAKRERQRKEASAAICSRLASSRTQSQGERKSGLHAGDFKMAPDFDES